MDHPTLQSPTIKAILAQPFGRFSDREFERRRQALTATAANHGCDAVLLCGEERTGTGVGWLTGWPTSARALVIFQPGERDVINVRERMQHAHKPERADFVIGVGAHWFDHG